MLEAFTFRNGVQRPGKRDTASFAGGAVEAAKQFTTDDDAKTDSHADLQKHEDLATFRYAGVQLTEGCAIDIIFQEDRRIDRLTQPLQNCLGRSTSVLAQTISRDDARNGNRDAAKNLATTANGQARCLCGVIDHRRNFLDRRATLLGDLELDGCKRTAIQALSDRTHLRRADIDTNNVAGGGFFTERLNAGRRSYNDLWLFRRLKSILISGTCKPA